MEVSGGSFIVTAHMIKLAVAARTEASATGSNLPLAATARFIAAPRTERFVATMCARQSASSKPDNRLPADEPYADRHRDSQAWFFRSLTR